jgi:hypothetical protein
MPASASSLGQGSAKRLKLGGVRSAVSAAARSKAAI